MSKYFVKIKVIYEKQLCVLKDFQITFWPEAIHFLLSKSLKEEPYCI